MTVTSIAFANLRRRKGKSLFLTAGIAIGIGTVVALLGLSGSIKEEIGSQLDRFGANIVVVPHSNTLALDYGGVSVSGVSFDVHELTNEDAARILEIPYRKRLSVIAPKLLSVTEIEGRQVVLAGVDFPSELRLKRWWRINGQKPAAEDDLLAGYEAARTLGLIRPASSGAPAGRSPAHHRSDDSINFSIVRNRVQLAGQEHRVSGVLAQTGGPEDRMIFGSLRHVQEFVGKQGQLSVIEVSALCKDCPVEDIVAQIRQKLSHARVSAVQQAVRARNDTVERLTKFAAAVSAVVLIIGGLLIFTTMMSAVVERTKEIGVLRAIGFRRVHIIKGLMIEAAAISVAGGTFGWAAGVLMTWLALPYFSETGVTLEIRSSLAFFAIGAALVLGILSSLYPAVRAARLDPCEAVRYV